jgi:mono/diheme cytochrome c family protein
VVIALAAVTAAVWTGEGDDDRAAPVTGTGTVGALDGMAVFLAKGCATCHLAPGAEDGFGIGPDLRNLLDLAASRVPGRSAEAYVRESILDPGAFVAVAPTRGGPYGTMPRLAVSEAEVDALVAYLLGA